MPDVDPTQLLGRAKATLDSAAGVHLVLTGRDVPAGVDALLAADGTVTRKPGFTGRMQMRQKSGIQLDAAVVAVGGKIYSKPAFSPVWITVDPKQLGIPDPAQLIDPRRGLTALLPATRQPAVGDRSRRGRTVVTEITGTLSSAQLRVLFPAVKANDSFAVSYKIAEDTGQLASMTLTGPFYRGPPCSYEITLDRYGDNPPITRPS